MAVDASCGPREENSNVWARVILVVFGVTVSFWSPKINGILTKSMGFFRCRKRLVSLLFVAGRGFW